MGNGKEEESREEVESKKVRFEATSKKSLREFNREELIGWVIDRLNRIEEIIDDIIVNQIKPDDKTIFRKIILNTSVLNFGAKTKVLLNLGVDKKLYEKLRKFLSIRNGFAHSRIDSSYTLSITKITGKPAEVKTVKNTSTIEVMNSAGKVDKKEAHEYVSEYLELYYEVRNELLKFPEEAKESPPIEGGEVK